MHKLISLSWKFVRGPSNLSWVHVADSVHIVASMVQSVDNTDAHLVETFMECNSIWNSIFPLFHKIITTIGVINLPSKSSSVEKAALWKAYVSISLLVQRRCSDIAALVSDTTASLNADLPKAVTQHSPMLIQSLLSLFRHASINANRANYREEDAVTIFGAVLGSHILEFYENKIFHISMGAHSPRSSTYSHHTDATHVEAIILKTCAWWARDDKGLNTSLNSFIKYLDQSLTKESEDRDSNAARSARKLFSLLRMIDDGSKSIGIDTGSIEKCWEAAWLWR